MSLPSGNAWALRRQGGRAWRVETTPGEPLVLLARPRRCGCALAWVAMAGSTRKGRPAVGPATGSGTIGRDYCL